LAVDQDTRNIPAGFGVTHAERGRSIRAPSLLAQALALFFFLGLVVVGLIVFIPLAIFAGVVFLIALGVVWVRLKFARAKAPNGPLDGRRNVRVRQ
jgi:Flp pilus assembly protein TadB